MHIALNALLLSRAASFRSAGINRVIDHLLRELGRDPRGHHYTAFVTSVPPPADPLATGQVQYRAAGARFEQPGARIAWEQSVLPLRLAFERPKPHLLHSLAYASPLLSRTPGVLTIYDLSFLRYPASFRRGQRSYLTVSTRISARRARRIVTISEFSKRDIVFRLGIPPERVVVAYPAADERFRPLDPAEVQHFRAEWGIPDTFLFSVGTLEPRKNLEGLLQAYARLPQPRCPLYIAGAAGWRFGPVFQTVQRLELQRDVVFLGFVSEEQLPYWYNSASLFVYPSLFEGFGLPVLEALACGTPAVTSNTSSLPEVAGDVAVTVTPTDHAALAGTMQALLADEGRRNEMRRRGPGQARRFTWSDMADRTVEAYEQTVGTRE